MNPPEARPEAVAPPPRQGSTYFEAVKAYEAGVDALQRRDYARAAASFREVLERFPEERELHERARLYLRVCERESGRVQAVPRTPEEHIYAATLALNAGQPGEAVQYATQVVEQQPGNDHAHYILAVAQTLLRDYERALAHLRRAIELNSDNRTLARQEPDLEPLRRHDGFRSLLDTVAGADVRRRPRRRTAR